MVHQSRGDGAVDPHHRARFQLFLFGTGDQGAIDCLPRLRANRADRALQHRFLWRPCQWQSGKGAKRRRILQVKGQLLITELALLLSRAQRNTVSAGSPCRPVGRRPSRRRSLATWLNRARFPSSQSDSAFSSHPIWCPAKTSNMVAWTVRSCRIVGSGGEWRLWFQWVEPELTRNRRPLFIKTRDFLSDFKSLGFMDAH